MRMEFIPGKADVFRDTNIYYIPDGWKLECEDTRDIISALSRFFDRDFHTNVSDGYSDYCTTYDHVVDFLSKAVFSRECMKRVVCSIRIQGNYYSVTVELDKNRISISMDEQAQDNMYSFDPVIREISAELARKRPGNERLFTKEEKEFSFDKDKQSVFKFYLDPRLKVCHDMLALKLFDQKFHLGIIYTEVWDYEWHFWRQFKGFQKYRNEAPAELDYEYLAWVSFDVVIDGVTYRVELELCAAQESVEISFNHRTEKPYDFAPVMEELEEEIKRHQAI